MTYDPRYQQAQEQAYFHQQPSLQNADTGRTFAIVALLCFAVAWIAGIATLIPVLGYAFLCFALVVHLLGFVFLGIAISKWPR